MKKSENKPFDGPSKSEVKRKMLELQALGERLVGLSKDALSKVPVEGSLKTAILEGKLMKSFGAKRRQFQYIGKLMRDIDADQIINTLNEMESKTIIKNSVLQKVEHWRDILILEQDDALQKFLALYPDVDRQQLRQIIRNCKKKSKGAEAELFRYIREIMTN